MNEPDVEAVVKAAAARRASEPAVVPVAAPVEHAARVHNPFVDPVTGKSLADVGQPVRGGEDDGCS